MTRPQTEPFVPLTAAALGRNGAAGYDVNVVSHPSDARAFKPLPAEGSGGAKISPTHANGHCEPRVSIQREGDQVTGIRIHCGCGQVIDLACIY